MFLRKLLNTVTPTVTNFLKMQTAGMQDFLFWILFFKQLKQTISFKLDLNLSLGDLLNSYNNSSDVLEV